jgi:hypothetical protein
MPRFWHFDKHRLRLALLSRTSMFSGSVKLVNIRRFEDGTDDSEWEIKPHRPADPFYSTECPSSSNRMIGRHSWMRLKRCNDAVEAGWRRCLEGLAGQQAGELRTWV